MTADLAHLKRRRDWAALDLALLINRRSQTSATITVDTDLAELIRIFADTTADYKAAQFDGLYDHSTDDDVIRTLGNLIT